MVTNLLTKKGGKFIQNVTYEDFQDKKHRNEYAGIQNLIKHCQKSNMLPCTIFCFSKIKIMSLANKLMSYDLCDKNEAGKISLFFNKAMKKLKPSDRDLP
jgi:antiviral helicase SKI2